MTPIRQDESDDRVLQSSGHTIFATHIEQPRKRFVVEFDSLGYLNILRFADTRRRVFVLAETTDGALAIARYHHGLRGSNFALVL